MRFYCRLNTETHRHAPRPQLNCHGPHCYQQPNWVTCTRPSSTKAWTCTTSYYDRHEHNTMLFQNIQIRCEGVEDDEDLNVYKHSCSLDYTLNLEYYTIPPPQPLQYPKSDALLSFYVCSIFMACSLILLVLWKRSKGRLL